MLEFTSTILSINFSHTQRVYNSCPEIFNIAHDVINNPWLWACSVKIIILLFGLYLGIPKFAFQWRFIEGLSCLVMGQYQCLYKNKWVNTVFLYAWRLFDNVSVDSWFLAYGNFSVIWKGWWDGLFLCFFSFFFFNIIQAMWWQKNNHWYRLPI